MGRLVQAATLERVAVRGRGMLESAGQPNGQSTTIGAVGGDKYQDRVVKYIPSEVVAAYMALDRLLVPDADAFIKAKAEAAARLAAVAEQAAAPLKTMSGAIVRDSFMPWMPLCVLLVGLIFTPLYIRQLAIQGGAVAPWRTHAVMATLAFLIWAYAIQGAYFTTGVLYNGTIASAMLIVFTLISGVFGPAPVNPDGKS